MIRYAQPTSPSCWLVNCDPRNSIVVHTHSIIAGRDLASELANQKLANSSFSFLSAALFLCDHTESVRKAPIRYCALCSTKMIHLSDLPSFRGALPVRIFRCYGCNNVVSEDR